MFTRNFFLNGDKIKKFCILNIKLLSTIESVVPIWWILSTYYHSIQNNSNYNNVFIEVCCKSHIDSYMFS